MTHKQLATYIGYVPQSIPVRFPANVFETILAGRRPHISWHPSNKDLDRTAEIIEEMNLTDLAMRDMARLSGGQAQKVLLARALAQDTPYLILDEPTSSLDLRHQLEILETISGLAKNKGLGVMMAMHDLNLAARFSDTIMMLHQGKSSAQENHPLSSLLKTFLKYTVLTRLSARKTDIFRFSRYDVPPFPRPQTF